MRTLLGVLTAASLMMFEGAVMATIQVQYSAVQYSAVQYSAVQYSTVKYTMTDNQEMGGDYGLQRFVGNFGAIIFAPLGGFLIDATSWDLTK